MAKTVAKSKSAGNVDGGPTADGVLRQPAEVEYAAELAALKAADKDPRVKDDPARGQYKEAFITLNGTFDGRPFGRVPFIWVDSELSLLRGQIQGFPKKLGSVFQTRSFSAPSAAAAPLAKGSRFGGSLAAHGERLVTARIQLEEKVENPAAIFNRPTVMRRYFPQLSAGLQEKPAVDELTMSLTDDLAVVDVWAGSAELKIPEVQGEDLHSLAPKRIGRGYRLGMSYSVTDLRILKNYVR